MILSTLKKYDEALQCWKKAVEIDDNYVTNWNKKASLIDSKGYDDSVVNRILVIKLAGKGASYAFMKKYDKALEWSNIALGLDENNSDNLNNKAWALNGLKKYEEALEWSDKALALEPNSAWALANKAWALNGLKKYDEALKCSDKALALDIAPFNPFALNNKGSGSKWIKKI